MNENVLPLPGSLSTQICPPWYSTISLQIGRPSPVPFGLSVSVSPTCLNFSNTFWLIAGRDADAGVGYADHDIVAVQSREQA